MSVVPSEVIDRIDLIDPSEPNPYLDPEKLFRSHYTDIVRRSSGLESLVWSILPFDLVKSFAKLDPTYQFKWSPVRITPTNRRRYSLRNDVLQSRKRLLTTTIISGSSPIHYGGITGKYGPIDWSSSTSTSTDVLSGHNPYRWRLSDDTTRRTRPWYSNHGEFDCYRVNVFSPPRILVRRDDTIISNSGTDDTLGWDISYVIKRSEVGPMGARLSADMGVFRNTRIAACQALITQYGPDMLAQVLPTGRQVGLFRSIAELKDIPRSIATLRSGLRNLSSLEKSLFSPKERRDLLKRSSDNLKGLPDQWLSYWFGWHSLYRDVLKTLGSPEPIARKVNRLIERSGKDSTFRVTRKFITREQVPTPFSYETFPGFTWIRGSTFETKRIELRAMINARFEFPPVSVPEFQRSYYLKSLGIFPSISDVYELTPWSWLLDWFTGVGNYLDCVEAVNGDPSIFNYGFITAVIDGELVRYNEEEWTDTIGIKHNPAPWVNRSFKRRLKHTSTLEYKVQVRRDIASISGATVTSDVDSLSPWQKSILGALILQRGLK